MVSIWKDDAYQRWRVFACPKQTFDLMAQATWHLGYSHKCDGFPCLYLLGQVEQDLAKAEKGYLKEMQQAQRE